MQPKFMTTAMVMYTGMALQLGGMHRWITLRKFQTVISEAENDTVNLSLLLDVGCPW